ncbi:MAG: hypothetical protein V4466_07185 [Pseudomonadota bacterium]
MSLADQRLNAKPHKADATCLATFFGGLALLFVAAPVVVWGVDIVTSLLR